MTIKPNAAVTLASGWYPFAMRLIHMVYPSDEYSCTIDNSQSYFLRNDKSPWMTSYISELIPACIHPEQYKEVVLPFLIHH